MQNRGGPPKAVQGKETHMSDTFIINDRPETNLRTADFFYHLPEELIAQHPMEKRDHSRLMVLDRESKTIEH